MVSSMKTFGISVVICTYNRCASLDDTLNSIAAMRVPESVDWNLIVVDNNSADATRKVVEEFAKRSPVPVKYLLETRQGLSFARNCAIQGADRDYIAFTDDDVLVDEQWLAGIVSTFQRYNADCVGGKVVPLFLAERPPWLADDLLNVLAMLDYGEETFIFKDDSRILFGANFAFRRESLIRCGLFNVELGRRGDVGCGEDKEMFEKVRALGGVAVYNPAIVVNHKVPPDRMRKRYFRRWHFSAGRDRAAVIHEGRRQLLGIEMYLYRDFALALGRLALSSAGFRLSSRFRNELQCILYFSIFRHRLLRWN